MLQARAVTGEARWSSSVSIEGIAPPGQQHIGGRLDKVRSLMGEMIRLIDDLDAMLAEVHATVDIEVSLNGLLAVASTHAQIAAYVREAVGRERPITMMEAQAADGCGSWCGRSYLRFLISAASSAT